MRSWLLSAAPAYFDFSYLPDWSKHANNWSKDRITKCDTCFSSTSTIAGPSNKNWKRSKYASFTNPALMEDKKRMGKIMELIDLKKLVDLLHLLLKVEFMLTNESVSWLCWDSILFESFEWWMKCHLRDWVAPVVVSVVSFAYLIVLLSNCSPLKEKLDKKNCCFNLGCCRSLDSRRIYQPGGWLFSFEGIIKLNSFII